MVQQRFSASLALGFRDSGAPLRAKAPRLQQGSSASQAAESRGLTARDSQISRTKSRPAQVSNAEAGRLSFQRHEAGADQEQESHDADQEEAEQPIREVDRNVESLSDSPCELPQVTADACGRAV